MIKYPIFTSSSSLSFLGGVDKAETNLVVMYNVLVNLVLNIANGCIVLTQCSSLV
jgi:hypothetical protein